jgi:hypothetical protein
MRSRLLLLLCLPFLLVAALRARAVGPSSHADAVQAAPSGSTPPADSQTPAAKRDFEPAWSYFERGRVVGFPSATPGSHYQLKATFQIPTPSNGLTSGRYQDIFVDATHWRREAWVGTSHLVRARDADKRYAEADGPDSAVLLMVLRVLEPIPDTGTFDSSVWRISHDKVGGIPTTRLVYGPETAGDELVPGQSQGFWFDSSGKLLRAFTDGVDVLRSDFTGYNGVQIAQSSVVRVGSGGVAMRIRVTSISRLTSRPPEWTFVVANHESRQKIAEEVR